MKTLRTSFSIFLLIVFLLACSAFPVRAPVQAPVTISCTAPSCESGQLVCGLQNGCPGGCGTVCKPSVVCSPPPCVAGQLVCGSEEGCPGGCGTVCEITALTPMPNVEVILDFAAQLCSAEWMNSGQKLTACPAEGTDHPGGHAELADPIPLNLAFDTLVLRTIPAWNGFGSLFLRYPGLKIEAGDRFQTVLTCDASTGCNTQFALEYYDSAGEYHALMAWNLQSGGAPVSVDLPLDELAGQKVDLVLAQRVFHSIESPNRENGLWISPQVVRPQQ